MSRQASNGSLRIFGKKGAWKGYENNIKKWKLLLPVIEFNFPSQQLFKAVEFKKKPIILKKKQIYSFYVDNSMNKSGDSEMIGNCSSGNSNEKSISDKRLEISKVELSNRDNNSFQLYPDVHVGHFVGKIEYKY